MGYLYDGFRLLSVFVSTKDGYTQVYAGDMNELHYGQYAAERISRGLAAPAQSAAVEQKQG